MEVIRNVLGIIVSSGESAVNKITAPQRMIDEGCDVGEQDMVLAAKMEQQRHVHFDLTKNEQFVVPRRHISRKKAARDKRLAKQAMRRSRNKGC